MTGDKSPPFPVNDKIHRRIGCMLFAARLCSSAVFACSKGCLPAALCYKKHSMKLIIFTLMLAASTLQAQTFGVKGTVGSERGQPVSAATVMLYLSNDSALTKVTVCDTAGNFHLTAIGAGSYYIIIGAKGFRPYHSADIAVTGPVVLPPVILQAQARQLTAVLVAAQKPLVEVKPDRTVFNVQSSIAATGVSAFDLLRKAPGVIIDNQNNLIVEGKTGVKIYIDGKISLLGGEDLTNYLKTLQSTDIDAIEIITQPSARYEAAGTGGILNLRLKANKNYGTNGSLAAGYAIGRYSKYTASASLNHRTAKLNLFSSYSNSTGKNRSFINLDRFQSGHEYNQRSYNISNGQNHNLRAGMYYTAGSASTIGVVVNGSFNRSHSVNTSHTPISDQATGTLLQVLDAQGFTANNNGNVNANMSYRYAGRKKHELTVDGDYGYYHADRNNLQPNTYKSSNSNTVISENTFRMITPVRINLASLKADYSQPLGKASFSAGIKTSVVKTNNTFNFYDVKPGSELYNPGRSNRFGYTENINAAYLNLSRSWKKVSMQAGVRAEQTSSTGVLAGNQLNKDDHVKRNYTDIFPSGGLTWNVDPKSSLGLTYSRRIERPDYRSLNPFEYNTDELSFSRGNPFLKPQYTHTVKLQHTYKYRLTTAIAYSYISNFFAQITDTLGTTRNFISPQNIANQRVIDISVSYPFAVCKWWSVYTSINTYRSSYKATNSKFVPITQNSLSLYCQNTISLPAGYQLEVSGWFSSPSIWAGTYRTQSLASLDMAVRKSLLKNAVSLRMAVSDLLYTSNWTGTTQYGQLYIKGGGGYESRQLRVSLSYNFGRKTVKAAESRKTGVEEEKSRIQN